MLILEANFINKSKEKQSERCGMFVQVLAKLNRRSDAHLVVAMKMQDYFQKYKCYNQHTQFYRQSRRMVPDQPQKQPQLEKSGLQPAAQQASPDAQKQLTPSSKLITCPPSPKLQKRAQIKFYSGYSSFNYEVSHKGFDPASDSHPQLLVKDHSINNSTNKIKNPKNDDDYEPANYSSKALKVQEDVGPEQRQERGEKVEGVRGEDEGQECFKEEDKERMGGRLQVNKMNTYFRIIKNKTVTKRANKGNISIAARKCQAIADTGEIFDEQELANNMIAPDQCRLWRNMMNKYLLKARTIRIGRKKGAVKSQFIAKADSLEGKNQQSEGNMEINRNQSVGKEEGDVSRLNSNQNVQRLAPEMGIKKQEELSIRAEAVVPNQSGSMWVGQQYVKQQQEEQDYQERQPKKQGSKIRKKYGSRAEKDVEVRVLKKRGRKRKQQL